MSVFGLGADRILLNKITYGPRPSELAQVAKDGLATFVNQQLAAPNADDPVTQALLASATLPLSYAASTTYPAKNVNKPIMDLVAATGPTQWKLISGGSAIAQQEISIVPQAVRAATWIRAVHSTYGLKEMMVEFWHNHFNVDAFQANTISAMFPVYDQIMRANWNGNFRTFLEAIATSACMGYYLNNVLSRATQPNENYGRELMELHTIGRDHYFDHQYPTWDAVPGALDGKPIGFIDDDVFGAARALSGWTIATGQKVGTKTYPNDGSFIYVPEYHSTHTARVLSFLLDDLTAPQAAGRKVLDLVATHPATANFVCTKIIRRLHSDTPPQSLIDKAVATFTAAHDKPDQLAQVLRTIILAPEFFSTDNSGAKFRRPYERVIGLLRMTGVTVQPQTNLFNAMSATGYTQFNWSPPTGHPDVAGYWLNSNATIKVWNLMLSLYSGTTPYGAGSLISQTPDVTSAPAIISYWIQRLLGGTPSINTESALKSDAMGSLGLYPAVSSGKQANIETALRRFVALIAASDDFSYR
jgi:uncharacterized protein (DUF1800 family)